MAWVKEDKKEEEGLQPSGDIIGKTETSGELGAGGTSGDFINTAATNQSFTAPSAAAFQSNIGKGDTGGIFGKVAQEQQQQSSELSDEQKKLFTSAELPTFDAKGLAKDVASGKEGAFGQATDYMFGQTQEPLVDQPFSDVESQTLSDISREGGLTGYYKQQAPNERYSSGMAAFDASVTQADPEFRRQMQEAQERQDKLEARRESAQVDTIKAAEDIRAQKDAERRDKFRSALYDELAAIKEPAVKAQQAYNNAVELYSTDTPERQQVMQSTYEQTVAGLPPELQQYAPSFDEFITEAYMPGMIEVGPGNVSLGAFVAPEQRPAFQDLSMLLGEDPLYGAYQPELQAYQADPLLDDILLDLATGGYEETIAPIQDVETVGEPVVQAPIDLSGAVAQQEALEQAARDQAARDMAIGPGGYMDKRPSSIIPGPIPQGDRTQGTDPVLDRLAHEAEKKWTGLKSMFS